MEVAATVLAPLTLITALLIYFGYTKNKSYFGYFGIGQGTLNLPVEDYLLRSADVAFGAGASIIGLAFLAVASDWILQFVRTKYPATRSLLLRATIVVGAVLLVAGLVLAIGFPLPSWLSPSMPAVMLAFGAAILVRWLLILDAERSPRRSSSLQYRRPAIAVLSASAIIAIFWGVTLYATDVGRGEAERDDQNPGNLPLVTVFSSDFLDLPVSEVPYTEVAVPGQDRYYRYNGLRLLTYSDGRWFLASGRYDPSYTLSVTILRDSESVRVQIADIR